ncbi:hypothetical protein LCGC14_1109930 [marine sediment metagenome]|uniref:Uncharacterized protein n=1 Tax=marine sediment metagenome TaxID=412755 RepID=A0A0F9MBR6_9ZZZZ
MKLTEISAPKYTLELTRRNACVLKTIMGRITGFGPGREFANELYKILNCHCEIKTDGSIRFSGSFVE